MSSAEPRDSAFHTLTRNLICLLCRNWQASGAKSDTVITGSFYKVTNSINQAMSTHSYKTDKEKKEEITETGIKFNTVKFTQFRKRKEKNKTGNWQPFGGRTIDIS